MTGMLLEEDAVSLRGRLAAAGRTGGESLLEVKMSVRPRAILV
jgi:hypothetical protein